MPRMRGLHQKNTKHGMVAVLLLRPDALHSSSIELYRTLLHVEESLRSRNLSMVFGVVDDQANISKLVMDRKVDALLLAGVSYPERLKSVLERYPTVWLTSHNEGKNDLALAGNEEIGQMAARYLLDRGHRSLAYLQIPEDHPVHATRCEFFEFTALRANAAIHRFKAPQPDIAGDEFAGWEKLYECVLEQIRALKKTKPTPTGIFIPMGLLTGLTYRALSECGMRPGKDVDVICCDQNMSQLFSLTPRPASIQIDVKMIAQRAVEELLLMIGSEIARSRRVRISISPHLRQGQQ